MNVPQTTTRRRRMVAAIILAALSALVGSNSITRADPLPPGTRFPALQAVSNLRVTKLGGTTARVSFETPRPTVSCVRTMVAAAEQPGARAVAISADELHAPLLSAEAGCDTEGQRYRTSHSEKFTRLTSNTTYLVHVRATTTDGTLYTSETRFTTLKKRLRISLDRIWVNTDGDMFSSGEPTWLFGVRWNGPGPYAVACYPYDRYQAVARGFRFPHDCREGSVDRGEVRPYTAAGGRPAFLFPEENFERLPNTLFFHASGFERDPFLTNIDLGALWDALFDCFPGCGFDTSAASAPRWEVPMDVERHTSEIHVNVRTDSPGFNSYATFVLAVYHDNVTYAANGVGPAVLRWR